jgi:sec-independent protein translocase protein TatA
MGVGVLSPWHIAIFAIVVLVVFGPKRLPEMGRSLGKGMREFKDSISGQPATTTDTAAGTPALMVEASTEPSSPAALDRDTV